MTPDGPSERAPIALVVDDDETFRDSLAELVRREGFRAVPASTLAEARAAVAERTPHVLLVDVLLPDGSGLELLSVDRLDETCEVVAITGRASVDTAVEALRQGCRDYLTKPVDRARLKSVLANVARTLSLKDELGDLRSELRSLGRFGPLVGTSLAMQHVYDHVSRVAPTEATVLIVGESGTGKELIAQTIHRLSHRRAQPFVAVNCGGITETLMESELFGHEKGSFTGADRRRAGYFERADSGTLFLDEITEMPLESQVKLLRVLESRRFVRVGGAEEVEADVRVVAATNRDPADAVEQGELRDDLRHRLNVFPIEAPPLRERAEDIPLLAEHFLAEINREMDTPRRWTSDALDALQAHSWPGNVRELRNAVHRAAILADRDIGPDVLPTPSASAGSHGPVLRVRVGTSIAEAEKRLLLATLEELGGDKRRAAEMLGISLKTLYNRLNQYAGETAAVPAGEAEPVPADESAPGSPDDAVTESSGGA
jgi:DNA-binding NtrC family response regulator